MSKKIGVGYYMNKMSWEVCLMERQQKVMLYILSSYTALLIYALKDFTWVHWELVIVSYRWSKPQKSGLRYNLLTLKNVSKPNNYIMWIFKLLIMRAIIYWEIINLQHFNLLDPHSNTDGYANSLKNGGTLASQLTWYLSLSHTSSQPLCIQKFNQSQVTLENK